MSIKQSTFLTFIVLQLVVLTLQKDNFIEPVLDYGFTAQDIINEGKLTEDELQDMRHMLHMNGYNILPDEMVVQFLLTCDKNLNETMFRIKNYFKLRSEYTALLSNWTLDDPSVQNALKMAQFGIIPRRTKDGYDVVVLKIVSSDTSLTDTEAFLKVLLMVYDVINTAYPTNGIILVMDLEEMGFWHMVKTNLAAVSRFITYVQEAVPLKFKNFHIINMMHFASKLMGLIKPLMGQQLREMLILHPNPMDMDAFYEGYVERECLPEELGGSQPSFPELHKTVEIKLRQMMPSFAAEAELRKYANYNKAVTVHYNNNVLLFLSIIAFVICFY